MTGWIMAVQLPLNEVIGRLNVVRNITIAIGSALIATFILLTGAYVYRLSASLVELKRNMRRAESGDFRIRAPEDREDEIGSLNRSFNNMAREIGRLVEVVHVAQLKEKDLLIRQKESMLRHMQSQIHPHFLYNTLEIINSQGIVHDIPEIVQASQSLTHILRYSLNQAKPVVSLSEEWEHALRYLDIQKLRYPDLIVELDADPSDLAEAMAVKLSIQPIIENAFKHGYQAHKLRPTIIRLAGERTHDGYIVTVEDRGRGMPPEQKERFDRLFALTDVDEKVWEREMQTTGHIGLINVHCRLRLSFGNRYGLTIAKSDANGTSVRIKLPFRPAAT